MPRWDDLDELSNAALGLGWASWALPLLGIARRPQTTTSTSNWKTSTGNGRATFGRRLRTSMGPNRMHTLAHTHRLLDSGAARGRSALSRALVLEDAWMVASRNSRAADFIGVRRPLRLHPHVAPLLRATRL